MENFEDNIEKEYHERFQDFEEMPDDAVWNKIQERIAPEPERRPIVFWWKTYRSMGIAASVLLGLTVGGYLFSTFYETKKSQIIVKNTKSTPIGENKQATQSTRLLTENTNKPELENIEKRTSQKTYSENKEAKKGVVSKIGNKNIMESDNLLSKSKVVDNEAADTDIHKIEKNQRIVSISAGNELLIKNNDGFDSKAQIEKPSDALTLIIQNEANKTEINGEKQNGFIQELAFIKPRTTDIQIVSKNLEIPTITKSEAVIAFEEPRRERLVFIPPTEVYANVSPMLNYYVFSPNKADNFVVKDFNGSSDRLSFAAQLGVVYPLSKKMDIRMGLSFMTGKSNISYGVTNINQKVVKVIDEHSIEVQPIRSITTEQRNWQYLEIQSDLLYAIKRLQAVSVGFRAGVQTSALNKPVFNGRIGYRISKPVNNRVALWLEPSVVLSLSSQQSLDNHFLYRTTGFSLNMGVSLLKND